MAGIAVTLDPLCATIGGRPAREGVPNCAPAIGRATILPGVAIAFDAILVDREGGGGGTDDDGVAGIAPVA